MFPELHKLMALLDLKQKDLAKIAGTSQQAMSKKLSGKTDLKRREMQKIKEYIRQYYPEITVDQIFTTDVFLPQ